MNTNVLSSSFVMADSVVSWGELNDGMEVKLVSSGGAFSRIFGLPLETQCLGILEGR